MNFDGPGATQMMGFTGSHMQGTQSGGADGKRAAQSLRAVTFRQILRDTADVNDEAFKVDDIDINTVTVVGRVVSKQENPTQVVLTLDDGTGKFDVSQWTNDGDERRPDYEVGTYLRVYGSLSNRGGKKNINAFTVKVVHDHNEITYHFLQCIYQHLQLTKGAPPNIPVTSASPALASGFTPATAKPSAVSGDVNEDVMSIYNAPEFASKDDGISLDEVHVQLKKRGLQYSQQQIQQAVEMLANEGLLFSTLDEQHYKSTTCC